MQIPSESSSACGSSKLFTKFYRDLGNFGGSGQQKRASRQLYYLTSQKRSACLGTRQVWRAGLQGVPRVAAKQGTFVSHFTFQECHSELLLAPTCGPYSMEMSECNCLVLFLLPGKSPLWCWPVRLPPSAGRNSLRRQLRHSSRRRLRLSLSSSSSRIIPSRARISPTCLVPICRGMFRHPA